MQNANRTRTALCNSAQYSNLTSRSSVQGFCWNDGDDAVDYWYPQGITTTRAGMEDGHYQNHQIVLTSWYHIPENEGTGVPNKGVVDTSGGVRIFDFERIYSVDTGRSSAIGRQSDGTYHAFDYAYIMVQIGWLRDAGLSLRHSFISLDRATSPDSNARVVRFPISVTTRLPIAEADGRTYGSEAYDTHIPQMQGVLARDGKWRFASSNGSSNPGYLRVWDRGTTSVRTYGWVIGAEDLTYYGHPDQDDLIWTQTEYPNRRAVIAVPQATWD